MNPPVLSALPCRFDRLVKTRYPANVLSGFEAAAGATFFNLNELQVLAFVLATGSGRNRLLTTCGSTVLSPLQPGGLYV